MEITFLVAVFSVLLAYLKSVNAYKDGLKAAFIIIFGFLAIRFEFGNDYIGYLQMFGEIERGERSLQFIWIADGERNIEWAWLALNKVFIYLGFFTMIAFLAALNSFILYRFIKKYVPQKYYWLAVFTYVFQPYFLLILCSAMRQNMAVLVFIVAIDFLIEKKLIHYLIAIFIASLFHTSAIVLFPLALFCFVRIKIGFISTAVILAIIFLVLTNQGIVFQLFSVFLASPESQKGGLYGQYVEQTEANFSWGSYPIYLFYAVIVFTAFRIVGNRTVFVSIAILNIIISFISIAIVMISRLNLYFQVALIPLYAFIAEQFTKKDYRMIFLISYVLFTCYQFYAFFNSDWKLAFGTYKTIFDDIL
jgi:transmembrane protein EpsG